MSENPSRKKETPVGRNIYSKDSKLPTPARRAPMPPVNPPKPSNMNNR